MDENMDVHNKKGHLKCILNKIENSETISPRNKELLIIFRKKCELREISTSRLITYLTVLRTLMEKTRKDFDVLRKEDVEDIIIGINKNGYSDYTKVLFKSALKKFIQIIKGFNWNDHKNFPDEVKDIILTNGRNHKLSPDSVITEEEVRKMILGTNNTRDKAIIALLFDSGCRISEIMTMQRKDIKFKNEGMEINVSGKTGERTVYPLLFALPYVSDWMKIHTNSPPETTLWVRVKGEWEKKNGRKYKFIKSYTHVPISYHYVRSLLKRIGEEIGIKKPLNPHNFRHSAVTKKYIQGLRGEFCKMYFGWSPNSNMISHYSHLSKEDLYREAEKLYGIKHKEQEENKSPLKVCQMCQERNAIDNRFCCRCGNNLNGDNTSMLERMARLEKLIDKRMAQLEKH